MVSPRATRSGRSPGRPARSPARSKRSSSPKPKSSPKPTPTRSTRGAAASKKAAPPPSPARSSKRIAAQKRGTAATPMQLVALVVALVVLFGGVLTGLVPHPLELSAQLRSSLGAAQVGVVPAESVLGR